MCGCISGCVCVCVIFAQKLMLNKAFLWLSRKNVLINAKYILKLTHTNIHQHHTTFQLRTHTHTYIGPKNQSHFGAHFNSIVEIFCT